MSTWLVAFALVGSLDVEAIHAPVAQRLDDHTERELAMKPFTDAAIEFDTESILTSGSASSSTLNFDIATEPGVVVERVEVTSSGNVVVAEPLLDVAAHGSEGGHGQVDIDIATLTGDATVTATLLATDTDGSPVTISDTIWLSPVDDLAVVSETGRQDLALRAADLGVDLGVITDEQADIARNDAIGGVEVETVLRAPKGPCSGICVGGTVEWTDAAGRTFPVRQAPVVIFEAGSGGGKTLTTTTTDDEGAFSVAIDVADNEPRDIAARVLAQGSGFRFVRDEPTSPTQYIESPVVADVVAGSTVTIPFIANNFDDNNTVFSLHNAMVIASEYLDQIGSPKPAQLDIVFPAEGTFYSSGRIHMLALDRWDWDVMVHEFGHAVAIDLGIDRSPGGPHAGNEHLADQAGRNKDQGLRLAWSEGWATYFAISALREMGAAQLGIVNVGDAYYQDTEDTSVVFDLERGRGIGEDNEVTVAAALWDLYDANEDDLDEIALGDNAVWSTVTAALPTTLHDVYAALTASGSRRTNNVNCVFTQMTVAPRVSGPGVIASTPPTFSWSPGNGGRVGANDTFVLEILRQSDGRLMHSSGAVRATTYTVPLDDWIDVTRLSDGPFSVSVTGTEENAPVTGPYRSCALTMVSDASGPDPADPDVLALFTSIDPARFADTRLNGQSVDGRFVAEGPRAAESVYRVSFAGRGSVPGDARAVIVNVTAVRPGSTGYVTAFDCGSQPLASSLNYSVNSNIGNEIVLDLGSDGAACFYTSSSTHLTLDVTGFVVADNGYETVAPSRLLDTRTSGRMATGTDIVVQVAGRGNVPSAAVAAIVNVTAVRPGATGYVTAHPCLDDAPTASSLNFVPGTNRANELIADLSDDGSICLFVSAPTDVIVDVVGYITAPSAFESLEPGRLLDTRSSGQTVDGISSGEGRRGAGSDARVQITGRHGVGDDMSAVIVNVTAVAPQGVGYVTVYPCSTDRPLVSSLNFTGSVTASNEIVARLDAFGGLCLYASNDTHLVVDVTGATLSVA